MVGELLDHLEAWLGEHIPLTCRKASAIGAALHLQYVLENASYIVLPDSLRKLERFLSFP